MRIIIQNEAMCNKCGDVVYSAHVHDFRSCKCGAIAVDGGQAYLRRVGDIANFTDRSLTMDSEMLNRAKDAVEKARKKRNSSPLLTAAAIIKSLARDRLLATDILAATGPEKTLAAVTVSKCAEAVEWALNTNRNSYGVVFSVIRALRDRNVLKIEEF